jgi:hypothetical protein
MNHRSKVKQEDTENCNPRITDSVAKLFVLPTNNIVSFQIVVPYDLDNPEGKVKLTVAPMMNWMDAFMDEMQFRINNS